jgi:hypothetical protein
MNNEFALVSQIVENLLFMFSAPCLKKKGDCRRFTDRETTSGGYENRNGRNGAEHSEPQRGEITLARRIERRRRRHW